MPDKSSNSHYHRVRLVVALLLLVSAALKAYELATEPTLTHGLLHSRWFMAAVVEFEIFFGSWLLAGVYSRATRFVAVACFCVFACVSALKGLSGEASCGCFGKLAVNPWYTFCLDVACVVALSAWPAEDERRVRDSRFRRAGAAVAASVAIGIPAGVLMANCSAARVDESGEMLGDGRVVIRDPATWVGKRFPLLRHIDVGDRLRSGNWIIVLYHYDCPVCQQALPTYEQVSKTLVASGAPTRMALIEVPPYGDDGGVRSRDGPLYGRLDAAKD
ncbi:MAG: hypothetical protein NUV77_18695, partial [Thermoguttaceae bacterium]|nr:hypothetical protein [Thermoguttaceae bacterium]